MAKQDSFLPTHPLNRVLLVFVVAIILSFNISMAYNTGFDYGVDKDKAYKALSIVEESFPGLLVDLEQVRFVNSYCVAHWGGYCNVASYEFKGNHNRVIIGRFNDLSVDDTVYYLLHELFHHKQVLSGKVFEASKGFPYWAEVEAEEFAINSGVSFV